MRSSGSVLEFLRLRRRRIAFVNAMVILCGWLAVVAAPCHAAMAHADAGAVHLEHDADPCPHCPPQPCHDVKPSDCAHERETTDSIRSDTNGFELPVGLVGDDPRVATGDLTPRLFVPSPESYPPRPRPHLVFSRFNE